MLSKTKTFYSNILKFILEAEVQVKMFYWNLFFVLWKSIVVMNKLSI